MTRKQTDDSVRIVIAVTELTPVQRLWHEAMRRLRNRPAELLALFVSDDHWHRAATLPFTREISRVSGMDDEFTIHRARQVNDAAIDRVRRRMQDLASDANMPLVFEVLSELDHARVRDLVAGSQNLLIAPSFIRRRPFYEVLENLGCRIVLIEAEEDTGDIR